MTHWTVTRVFGTSMYTVDGAETKEEALLSIYSDAMRDGVYQLPKLREKWWQIWRPSERSEFELRLIAAMEQQP